MYREKKSRGGEKHRGDPGDTPTKPPPPPTTTNFKIIFKNFKNLYILMKNLLLLLSLVLAYTSYAEQPIQYTYDEIASGVFWHQLYGERAWTLYCGLMFNRPNKSEVLDGLGGPRAQLAAALDGAIQSASLAQDYEQNKQF